MVALVKTLGLMAILVIAACNDPSFTGTAKTTVVRPNPDDIKNFTEPPKCVDSGLRSIAPNLAFIIDNSASNGSREMTTDCPNGQLQADNWSMICNAPTMRENAVKSVTNSLIELANREANNAEAIANIAVGMFPRSNQAQGLGIWKNVKALQSNELDQILSFTRRPSGDTPLLDALSFAEQLKATTPAANSQRKTFFIIISDGFPNDRNVQEVKSRAAAFKQNSEVFVLTNTNGGNYNERRNDFMRIMSSRWTNNSSWASPAMPMNQYLSLMLGNSENEGVINEVADKHFIINSSSDMPQVLNYIINSSGGVQCVN